MTARNAASDAAMTARPATGDNTMPEGEDTPPMTTKPARKIRAGGSIGRAAIEAETVTRKTRPTQKTTKPNRMRSVVARADTAGLLLGATTDGPW